MSEQERAQEVAGSSCTNAACPMCAHYIRTGAARYRPADREDYMAGLRKSYPNGIPEDVLPGWARGDES